MVAKNVPETLLNQEIVMLNPAQWIVNGVNMAIGALVVRIVVVDGKGDQG